MLRRGKKGLGLINLEDCVGMEIIGLGNYLMLKDEEFLMWMKNFEKKKKRKRAQEKKGSSETWK